MKSSEAISMILAVMNAIFAIAKKPEKFRTSTGFDICHFIVDSFLTGAFEPINDQLPTSVAS